MGVTFHVFNRWGVQKKPLEHITAATLERELNGVDVLRLETTDAVEKGDRVVFKSPQGAWREYIVSELEQVREGAGVITTITAESSLSELTGDYITDKRPKGGASAVLTTVLAPTRWSMGRVDTVGTQQVSFYHVSAYEALRKAAEKFKAEVTASYELDTKGTSISRRMVNFETRAGRNTGRVFRYSHDLASVKRTVEVEDVITALYAYGKGEEKTDAEGNGTGAYGRKITLAEVNGGKDYIEDLNALKVWGRPDANGKPTHVFGRVDFDECEDRRELLRLAREELKKRTAPRVTYEVGVVDLLGLETGAASFDLGDSIRIEDETFAPTLKLEGRILKIEEDFLAPENTKLTLGNLRETFTVQAVSQYKKLESLDARAGAWDSAAALEDSYMDAVINRMNNVLNADGGYVYFEQGEGILILDKPKDSKPTKAIKLGGGGFRIANSKRADGTWNWRTFGTGDGFTADNITAGTIRGGRSFWNLSTGELSTQNMKAQNMTATGNLTSGGANNACEIANGMITGYENGRKVATIDYSTHVKNLQTGYMMQGMQLQGNEIIRISTPCIGVSDSADTSVTSTSALNKEVRIPLGVIVECDKSLTPQRGYPNQRRYLVIKFINGICVSCYDATE